MVRCIKSATKLPCSTRRDAEGVGVGVEWTGEVSAHLLFPSKEYIIEFHKKMKKNVYAGELSLDMNCLGDTTGYVSCRQLETRGGGGRGCGGSGECMLYLISLSCIQFHHIFIIIIVNWKTGEGDHLLTSQ